MIEERRSIRKYKNKNVSREQIETIVKAAILAPSAKNRQPWKYIIYTGEEKSKLLDVMENLLLDFLTLLILYALCVKHLLLL